jgi:nucleoside-diphosphate kinase
MTSGPILLLALRGENAVAKNREIMGATDPSKAAPGTLRKDFADSIEANAVHGSDSLASAQREIAYFFDKSELCHRE